jgi:uncharacterized protein YidB (DUF937 family)
MGLFDDAVPGGKIGKPLMVALGALLVSRMLSGGQSVAGSASPAGAAPEPPNPARVPEAPDGGLAGGLGGLLDKLRTAGQSEAADSWVGTGENKPIQPRDLGKAIGQPTISDIARRAGMSEEELVQQLSAVLPGLVDKLTPEGSVPTNDQLGKVWRG